MSNGRQLNQPFFKLLDKLVRSEVSNMARPGFASQGKVIFFWSNQDISGVGSD